MSRFSCTWLGAVAATVLAGCHQRPARIEMPDFEPAEVAEQALSELDADGSAMLSREECSESPGLLASFSVFDANNDGKLSRAEIESEIRKWQSEKASLFSIQCEVIWKGRPLPGATVHLVPESFLGDVIPDAAGVTDALGMTDVSCTAEHLPARLRSIPAVKPGVYRIEVTHPDVDLPARYNSQTTLGRCVSLRNSQPMKLSL